MRHPSASRRAERQWPRSGSKRAPIAGRIHRVRRPDASGPVPASRTSVRAPPSAGPQADDSVWGDDLRTRWMLWRRALMPCGHFHADSAVTEETAGSVEHGLTADAKLLA